MPSDRYIMCVCVCVFVGGSGQGGLDGLQLQGRAV